MAMMHNAPTDPTKANAGVRWPSWLLPTDIPLDLFVTEAEPFTSNSGNPCIKITLHELGPDGRATERRVTHYGVVGYPSFSDAIQGIAPEIPVGAPFDTNVLLRRFARVVLKKDSYEKDGRTKDAVKVDRWLPLQGQPQPTRHMASAPQQQTVPPQQPQQGYQQPQQGYQQPQQGYQGQGNVPGYGQTYGAPPQQQGGMPGQNDGAPF